MEHCFADWPRQSADYEILVKIQKIQFETLRSASVVSRIAKIGKRRKNVLGREVIFIGVHIMDFLKGTAGVKKINHSQEKGT